MAGDEDDVGRLELPPCKFKGAGIWFPLLSVEVSKNPGFCIGDDFAEPTNKARRNLPGASKVWSGASFSSSPLLHSTLAKEGRFRVFDPALIW